MKASWVGGRLVGLIVAGFIMLVAGSADAEVGIDEKLGDTVPLDLEFLDENGNPVTLGDLIDGPTVLSLVYFKCPGICGPLMGGVADVIEKMDMVPGTDYRVLTISFDPSETPDLARRKKATYFKVVRRPLGEDGWRFLTGDAAAVDALTDAVGFALLVPPVRRVLALYLVKRFKHRVVTARHRRGPPGGDGGGNIIDV